MTLPTIHDGDTLVLFSGSIVRNNGTSEGGEFVNVTHLDDPRFGIPVHRDTRHIIEVWRGDVQIYPPETVQLSLFDESEVRT